MRLLNPQAPTPFDFQFPLGVVAGKLFFFERRE